MRTRPRACPLSFVLQLKGQLCSRERIRESPPIVAPSTQRCGLSKARQASESQTFQREPALFRVESGMLYAGRMPNRSRKPFR